MSSSLSVQEFINSIPNLLKENERTNVVVSTYNDVFMYEEGTIDTAKKDLNIQLYTGGSAEAGSFADVVFGLMIAENITQASEVMDEVEEEAISIQKDAKEAINRDIEEIGENLIFITYAGRFAYKENVKHAKEIRKKFPEARIFVLTCDCDKSAKERELFPLTDTGEINAVIMSPSCGGRNDLGDIIKRFIDA